MKKLLLFAFMAITVNSFAQGVTKNGTIYKDHPYITAVNQVNALMLKGDTIGMSKFYADTARFWDSPEPKWYGLKEAMHHWKRIMDMWSFTIKTIGYPDGLQYDKDPFTVQSWSRVTATNKKTNKTATFEMVTFDTFDKAGKISSEISYYDLTAILEAMK